MYSVYHINKYALPITITKSREVRFFIQFLQMLRLRFRSPQKLYNLMGFCTHILCNCMFRLSLLCPTLYFRACYYDRTAQVRVGGIRKKRGYFCFILLYVTVICHRVDNLIITAMKCLTCPIFFHDCCVLHVGSFTILCLF
jgi:hypothetical protein